MTPAADNVLTNKSAPSFYLPFSLTSVAIMQKARPYSNILYQGIRRFHILSLNDQIFFSWHQRTEQLCLAPRFRLF